MNQLSYRTVRGKIRTWNVQTGRRRLLLRVRVSFFATDLSRGAKVQFTAKKLPCLRFFIPKIFKKSRILLSLLTCGPHLPLFGTCPRLRGCVRFPSAKFQKVAAIWRRTVVKPHARLHFWAFTLVWAPIFFYWFWHLIYTKTYFILDGRGGYE